MKAFSSAALSSVRLKDLKRFLVTLIELKVAAAPGSKKLAVRPRLDLVKAN